ncbi:MAG: hypothetical protein ABSC06_06950 [Rhodopila sp.]
MANQSHAEQARDETLNDSFPASSSGITSTETPDKPPQERDIEERPTGTPTSDRHAAETAHQWEHEHTPQPKR